MRARRAGRGEYLDRRSRRLHRLLLLLLPRLERDLLPKLLVRACRGEERLLIDLGLLKTPRRLHTAWLKTT